MFSDDDEKRGRRKSAPHATQQGAATPGQRESAAAGNVAESRRAPIGHRSASSSSSVSLTEAQRLALERADLADAYVLGDGIYPRRGQYAMFESLVLRGLLKSHEATMYTITALGRRALEGAR